MQTDDPEKKGHLENNGDGMLTARERSALVKLSILLTMRSLQCMKGEIILTVLKNMHFSVAAIHFFLELAGG